MDNKENPGISTRPPASAHLLVSSTDRYNDYFSRLAFPTTASTWKTNKYNNILNGYFTRLAITQLNFLWNIPTIVDGKNDVLTLIFDNDEPSEVIMTIGLPGGFYTPTELAAAFETAVTTHPDYDSNWVFTCDFIDNHFVLDVDTGYTLIISPPPDTPGAIDPADSAELRLCYTMGFTNANFEPAETQVTGIPTMLYTRYIDICSNKLTQFQRVKDAATLPQNLTSDQIARVYAVPPNVWINPEQTTNVTFSQPWNMTIDYNTPKHIKWDVNQAIDNFDISCFDEYGDVMYWTPQFPTEYNFTFLASET